MKLNKLYHKKPLRIECKLTKDLKVELGSSWTSFVVTVFFLAKGIVGQVAIM